MRIVRPIEITDGNLTSSSIPVPDASVGEVEWVADRFSGIDISSIVPQSYVVRDIKYSTGSFYVMAGPEFSNPTVYVISSAGSLIVSYLLNTFSLAFTVSSGFLYSVNVTGSVFKYDATNGSLDSSIDISANVTKARAIEFYNDKFFIFDNETSTVKRFSSNFDYESFSFSIPNGIDSVSSIRIFLSKIHATEAIAKNSLRRFTIGGDFVDTIQLADGISSIDYDGTDIYVSTYSSDKKLLKYNTSFVYYGYYQPKERAILTSTKKVYQCVKANDISPDVGATGDETATWVEVGAVNKWKPFDKKPSQQAESTGPITYEFYMTEFVRSVCVFNMSGVSDIQITVTSPAEGVTYDKNFEIIETINVYDMWTYYTAPILFKDKLIVNDIIALRGSTITVTFNGANPKVGSLLIGDYVEIGRCVTGTGQRSRQFSTRVEDGFGGFDIVRRGVGDISTYRVGYDIQTYEFVSNVLKSIDNVYCVFIGDKGWNQTLSTYGVLDPYQTSFETPTENTIEFDVLGVL